MAGQHSGASEFHRAEPNPYIGQRAGIASFKLERGRRSGIPWANYYEGCGARPHSQDSGADSLGCLWPQRGGRTFGNQEVHPLLPDAKAWHLTYQQEFASFIAASPLCADRSSDQFKSADALVIRSTSDLISRCSESEAVTHNQANRRTSLSAC